MSPCPSKPPASRLCTSSCSYSYCSRSCSCYFSSGMGWSPECTCFTSYTEIVVKRFNAKMLKLELEAATKKMDTELKLKDEDEGVAKKEEPSRFLAKKTRCLTCRKKVGLTFFACRCGGIFCALHRYSDKHQCDFDYNALARQEIARNNPVIQGAKLNKI